MTLRTIIRYALAAGILLFALFATSQVAAHAAGSSLTMAIAVALLLVLLFATTRKHRA